jgi:hypothetical protein
MSGPHQHSFLRYLLRSALAAAALTGVPAGAQVVSTPAPATAPADADAALFARVKSDLRNLVVAQEARYASRGAYALSITDLGEAAYRPSAGVKVEIVNPGANGYGAVARVDGRPGTCVIHVGLDPAVGPRTEVEKKMFPEGEPSCDGDGLDERARWASMAQSSAQRLLALVAKLQERQFGRTGAYAAQVTDLEGVRMPATVSVTIEVQQNDRMGSAFLATATDSRFPGYTCVVRSGNGRFGPRAMTAADRRFANPELQVACDTFR